jgi:enoyl-CoA hydratase
VGRGVPLAAPVSVNVADLGPVRVIELARPEVRNAIDRATADALAAAFEAFERDESASVAVLCGQGGSFCAGADLKAIAAGEPNRVEPEGSGPLGPTRMQPSKPVIAAIEGYAVAGGLELACWCDLRVAAEDATLGVFCRRWGVPLIDGGTVRLPRLIGLSRALDLILTGRAVSAPEALAMGLVNRTVPRGEARAAAITLAMELAALPQACLRGDRRAAIEGLELGFPEAMRNEFTLGVASLAHAAEGVRRFAGAAR